MIHRKNVEWLWIWFDKCKVFKKECSTTFKAFYVDSKSFFLSNSVALGWFKSGKNDKLDILLLFQPDSESFGKWCLEKCKNFFDTTTLRVA